MSPWWEQVTQYACYRGAHKTLWSNQPHERQPLIRRRVIGERLILTPLEGTTERSGGPLGPPNFFSARCCCDAALWRQGHTTDVGGLTAFGCLPAAESALCLQAALAWHIEQGWSVA